MANSDFKIAVYAISKNEILHCERWANATQGADYRIVVDTGSTDGTQDKLKELGVTVYQSRIQPFRFDVARNTALALVPDDADICLILDMDEVPEPKFFDKVRKGWKKEANLGWISMDTGQKWERDRLHSRDGFVWKYPCHEVQLWYGEGEAVGVNIKNAVIKHEPDQSKSRGQYLSLLELAVKENPHDARMWTYMCREYYFHSRWQDVIDSAKKQLECTGWDVEQAAVCRWAGEAEHNLGNKEEATKWFAKGAEILPREGEPWYGIAVDAYRNNDWSRCLSAAINALESPRSVHYCYESAVWDWKAADLASISAYNLRHINEAIAFGKEAVKGNGPETDRIKRNLEFYEKVRDDIRAQAHKPRS